MASVALITGAGGLLGQHLLDAWDGALEPVLVDRAVHDLLVPGVGADLVADVRPQVVVHLAWVASGTAGYRSHGDNERWLHASLELASAAQQVGAHFCATGTAVDTGEPADAYSAAKGALRRALERDIARQDVTWLRPFYVVDPDRGRPDLVAQAVAAANSGEPLTLRTPRSAHDFVHAADVGRGIMTAVTHTLLGEVEIGSGTARPVHQLVEALGVAWRPGSDPGTGTHHHHVADTARLRARGWHPTRTEELFQ